MRHLGGGELNDKEALELENKVEAMGYGPRAMLFGGEDQMLNYVPDADESKIVKNITRSIGFPKMIDSAKLRSANSPIAWLIQVSR